MYVKRDIKPIVSSVSITKLRLYSHRVVCLKAPPWRRVRKYSYFYKIGIYYAEPRKAYSISFPIPSTDD